MQAYLKKIFFIAPVGAGAESPAGADASGVLGVTIQNKLFLWKAWSDF